MCAVFKKLVRDKDTHNIEQAVTEILAKWPNLTQDNLKTAIERLHYWQYGKDPTDFTSHLYLMFQKADQGNYRLLAQSFPAEAMAHQMWWNSPDQDEFFAQWDLKPGECRNHATKAQKEKDIIELLAEVEQNEI